MKNKVYVFFIILILTLLLLYFLCYETKEQRRARLSDDVITFIDQIQTRKDLISIPAYCISSDESHEITHTNFQRFQRIHNNDQKAAIYAAYKNGDEIAVIMNDQMYANIIDHSIEDIITQTPNDWDILDLYTSSKGKMSPKKIGNYLYQQLDEDENVNENVNENIAYIINRKGMEKMLFSPTSQRNRYGIYPGIMIPNPIADLKKDLSTLELSTEIINKHKSKLLSLKNKEKLKDLINNLKTHNEKVGFTCDIPCPVYYINMDKDVDRRQFMERQIEKMPNVHFTRITGFNGYAIENKRNDVIKHDHALIEFVNKYDEMSKSEIGCTMSHLIAIKKAYKNGDEIAMICEDDILFDTCTLIKPISEMIENAPKNWEILQLSSFTPKEIHEKSKNHPNTEYIRNNGKQRHYNTACYLINRNGMETILKMTSSIHRDNFFIINKNLNFPSSGTADIFIYELCVTYTILPVPFTVDNTDNDSTIHTDHTDDHIMFSINTLSKFNEIKNKSITFIIDENYSVPLLLNLNNKNWKAIIISEKQNDIIYDERIKTVKKNDFIKLCDTKWLIFMNKDDLPLPTFIETLNDNLNEDTDVMILKSLENNENLSLCIKKDCIVNNNMIDYSNHEILKKLKSIGKKIVKSNKINYISSPNITKNKVNSTILNLIIYNEKSVYEVDMKKIVQKYLKRFNFVTFYFICYRENQHNYIEIENNCIYIKGNEGFVPQVLDKTIIAIDYCVNTLQIQFDYFVRSNISSLIDFNLFPILPKNNLYTGPEILHLTWTDAKYGITEEKLHQIYGLDYAMGSCIILSKDMVEFLLKHKSKLDRTLIDDVAIGVLFKNKKILPYKFSVSVSENDININSFYTRNKTINDRYKDVERMQTILDISNLLQ